MLGFSHCLFRIPNFSLWYFFSANSNPLVISVVGYPLWYGVVCCSLNLDKRKNKDKMKEILDTTKIMKSLRQPKHLKRILTSNIFRENTTEGVTKCNNKRCKI